MSITAKDVIDAMTYGEPIEESFEVDGVSVEVWHDMDSTNPYHDNDGMPPAIWFCESYQEYGNADLENVIWKMSPSFVSHHWRKIADILDLDEAEFEAECQDRKEWQQDAMSNIRQEYFSERLNDMKGSSWGYACDYLDAIASLYRLQGIAADTFQSNGYSQGDCARGLIVHTNEWKAKVGFNGDSEKDMQSECQIYGAWAWGSVYGFTVEDEYSCGGFYGFDGDYMAEHIADAINHVLAGKAEAMAQEITA